MALHASLDRPLRITTWLAPSLPLSLFERVAERIGRLLRVPIILAADASRSGPEPWVDDPFASGEVDVGFLCAPSWWWLSNRDAPSVVPVAAQPVPLDERARGRPVYFSDVIVPSGGAPTFDALRGGRWAYNDSCSLSGWFSLESRVGDPRRWFGEVLDTGSHLASVDAVADGRADGAAIDSTVLGWLRNAEPGLFERIRIVTSFGPHPIQPVVARAGLPPSTIAAIGAALCTFDPSAGPRSPLARYGLAGFVPQPPEPLSDTLVAAFARAMAAHPRALAPAG